MSWLFMVAKVLELQLVFNTSPSNEYLGLIPFRIDCLISWCPRDFQESSPAPQFESINPSVLNIFYGPTLTSVICIQYTKQNEHKLWTPASLNLRTSTAPHSWATLYHPAIPIDKNRVTSLQWWLKPCGIVTSQCRVSGCYDQYHWDFLLWHQAHASDFFHMDRIHGCSGPLSPSQLMEPLSGEAFFHFCLPPPLCSPAKLAEAF